MVFQREEDRNACGNLFLDPRKEPPTLQCATKVPPMEPRLHVRAFKVLAMTCGVQGLKNPCEKKRPLTVKAAPEPDEVLWENLQLSDHYEEIIVFRGTVLLFVFGLVGFFLLFGAKTASIVVKNVLAYTTDSTGTAPLYTKNEQTAVNTFMTLIVATVTSVVNEGLRAFVIFLSKKEGQDTLTEEQASVFSKLSVAYVLHRATHTD